jgi:hypothetical protein
MPIAINGSGTITGISVGGIPDGTVDTDVLAANAVTYAKIGTTEQGQLCKAWVNFNGTSTVAIRASYNVSSITDNGTGDYTVNFTSALADANYGWTTSNYPGASLTDFAVIAMSPWTSNPTSSALRLGFKTTGGTSLDPAYYCVAIFR